MTLNKAMVPEGSQENQGALGMGARGQDRLTESRLVGLQMTFKINEESV